MSMAEGKKRKPKKKDIVVIQVTETDGEVKRIGKYDPNKKLFIAERNRSEHFMIKLNSWGLDAKVLDYLVKESATIHIKDKESKQTYAVKAGDFKFNGVLEEHGKHRPQMFLELNFWEVVQTKNKSYVLKCEETDCRFNIAKYCVRGIISIGEDGECTGFEDK
jgi:hypothetical protein